MFSRHRKKFSRIETSVIKVLIWSLVIKGVVMGELDHNFIMFLAGV